MVTAMALKNVHRLTSRTSMWRNGRAARACCCCCCGFAAMDTGSVGAGFFSAMDDLPSISTDDDRQLLQEGWLSTTDENDLAHGVMVEIFYKWEKNEALNRSSAVRRVQRSPNMQRRGLIPAAHAAANQQIIPAHLSRSKSPTCVARSSI